MSNPYGFHLGYRLETVSIYMNSSIPLPTTDFYFIPAASH